MVQGFLACKRLQQQPSERDCYTVNTVNICRAEQCYRPVTPALGRKNHVQSEFETHLDYMLSSQGSLDYKQNFLCFKKKITALKRWKKKNHKLRASLDYLA